jgi:hypothetical protein
MCTDLGFLTAKKLVQTIFHCASKCSNLLLCHETLRQNLSFANFSIMANCNALATFSKASVLANF